MRIIIFSRPVRSGKTTELVEWCKEQDKVDGVLMPDINGLRCMQRVSTNETWEAEIRQPGSMQEPLVHIGKFCFLQSSFDYAEKIFEEAERKANCIVIDEIGKLELQKKGFHSSLVKVLSHSEMPFLVLVIRDVLLEELVLFYQLKDYLIVHDLNELSL